MAVLSSPALAAPAAAAAAQDPTAVSEVVINASAIPYQAQPGAAVGDIAPEVQLDPAEIQSYGVSTVTELLDELAPQTGSNQGRGGESPVVLLNGKRISGFEEVRDIPTEAILRVDILPEEVALKYGFTADQKVVNFVLKPRFRSTARELTGFAPTAGGGDVSGTYEGDRFQVRGDNRVNLDVKLNGNTDLPYAARGLTGASNGAPYALMGNVVSARGRGPIDAALTAAAGRPLTVVGAPASAAGAAPSLAAFAATPAHVDDLGRYRDLVGEAQSLSVNLVAARALGGGYSATLNAAFTANNSQSMQGLPGLRLIVPAASPYSPFSTNVALDRYAAALGPLEQKGAGWTGHLGGTLDKVDAGRWRFSLTAAYDHDDSLTEAQTGIDPTGLQDALDAGSAAFNPYGAIGASMLARLPNSEARSISDGANIQGVAYGSLLKVPAGDLDVSVKIGDSQTNLTSASFRLGVLQNVELARNDASVQANLDLPLTSRRRRVLPWMGELTVNANLANHWISGFGVVRTLGYGLNWRPIEPVRLLLSETHDQTAPSVSQLGGPTVVTPNVVAYDFVTGQTVDITTLSGGNPNLTGDSRSVFKVGLTLKPWSSQRFTVTANYVDQRVDRPIGGFPAITAAIEAAFPSRFLRDAAGDLVQEDVRPINLDWTRRQTLRWGFNLSKEVGKAPAAAQGRRSGGGGPGRGRRGEGGAPRLQIAVYHTIYFADQTLLGPRGPLLDFLNGQPVGQRGAQPVNGVEGQLGYINGAYGARIGATWVQGTSVDADGLAPAGRLTFSDLTTINLRLFVNFDRMADLAAHHPWLSGSRLTFNLYNVFDNQLIVRDAAGVTPIGYSTPFLDPTGRTFALSFRKLFL